MNNSADVPLLTAEMAGNIRDFFRAIEPAESEYPEDDAGDDAALDAIANGAVITKSAAAEEADRAQIDILTNTVKEAVSVMRLTPCAFGLHDNCGKCHRCLNIKLWNAALFGGSENG